MKTSLTPSNKLQRTPDSAAPAPAARPGPSVASRVSTAFAGFSGLRARGSTGQDAGMAPRSSISLRGQPSATQAFSSAGHHAQKAFQDLSSGLRHEAKQQTNDFKAFVSETKSNYGTAEIQRMKQAYHQKVAQSAYASAASHARSFFGAAAQGITQSVRQAASAVTSMVVNFDPHQLAQKSARYGDTALAKASQLAQSALQLVEATAQSAVNGTQKSVSLRHQRLRDGSGGGRPRFCSSADGQCTAIRHATRGKSG